MGCGLSKPEEQQAVTHCRARTVLLAQAIQHRYALADAHRAYAQALGSVGPALFQFLNAAQVSPAPPSPVLTLPAQRKGVPYPPPPVGPAPVPVPVPVPVPIASASGNRASHSRSHSGGSHIQFSDSDSEHGSHLHFHSDEDDEFEPGGHVPQYNNPPTVRFNMNYARNQPPPPSVSFEQRPPETVYQSSYDDPYMYQPQSSGLYPPQYPLYPSYTSYNSGFSEMGGDYNNGYFGTPAMPSNFAPPREPAPREDEPPPAPPSPPQVSTWDFLNPFESYDSYYAAPYTPSRSSKEVREEEGIPDLEEEQEVVKEAYGDEKMPTSFGKEKAEKGEASGISGEDPHRKSRSLEAGSSSNSEGSDSSVGPEHDINVVDKNVVGGDDNARRSVGNLPVPVLKSYTDDAEVVREIKVQFEKACESASRVYKILEVGKQPYQQKSSPLKATVKMICGLPSLSNPDEDLLKFEEDLAISSTLQKLYIWEKKLLEEVKTEEEMRVLYDRKCQELRQLDEKGAEVHKIEATQAFIRKLSTRISIAIQIVNTISTRISKLRDDELWPQIFQLLQGFMQMWTMMSECHRIQCHAISAAKNLDAVLSFPRLSDSHLDYTKELEIRLLDWITSFTAWVTAQRNYIKFLNEWLLKGLVSRVEDEMTEDGPIPFSPGRMGAPPIFVICNQWSNSIDMDMIKDKESEVIGAIRELSGNVYQLWERHRFERRQALMANADGMDRALKSMDRDEQKMKKEIEIRNKKLEMISGTQAGALEAVQNAEIGSLQLSLRHVFEALEHFTASSAKIYEDLNVRYEEEKERFKDNSKVS